jgi:hypothetical protein
MNTIETHNGTNETTDTQLKVIYDSKNSLRCTNEELLDNITYPMRKLSSYAYQDANNDADVCKQHYLKCQDVFHETINDRARMSMFQQHGQIEKVTPTKVTILDNLALVEAHTTFVGHSAHDMPMYYLLLRNSNTDEYQFYRPSSSEAIKPEFLFTLAVSTESNAYYAECGLEAAIAK